MAGQYSVQITDYAWGQMQQTVNYISGILESPQNAERWLTRLEQEFETLSFLPGRVRLTQEELWHSRGIHQMAVGNHLVYFWIEEASATVWITAVVYGRREQRKQLAKMDNAENGGSIV